MKISKILLGILLVLIFTLVYIFFIENFFETNFSQEKSIVEIDAIVIPKKAIEFSLIKKKDGDILFTGSFSKKETPFRFAKFLNNNNLVHKLDINPGLCYDKDIVILTEQLIQILIENFIEGSILYEDKKLLISGKLSNEKDKDRLDSILEYSSVNSFNFVKVLDTVDVSTRDIDEVSDVISNLKVVVSNEESVENTPSKDEVSRIISILEVLTYEEIQKKEFIESPILKIKEKIKNKPKKEEVPKKVIQEKLIKKEPIVKKVENLKKSIKQEKVEESVKNKEYIAPKIVELKMDKKKVLMEDKKAIIFNNDPELYVEQKRVEDKDIIEKSEVDEDIMSLPMVETYNIDSVIEPLKTKKPMISEKTLYIPSAEKKIDDEIPWANLHEMDEKLDGILID